MNIEKANTEATERMMEARPVLVGLGKARDVIPDMWAETSYQTA